MMKKCSRCDYVGDRFCKRKESHDGFKSWCKSCDSAYDKANKDWRNERKARNEKARRLGLYSKLKDYVANKGCIGCNEKDM